MTPFIALVLVLLWPTLAAANRIETFLGWSSEGTAYGYVDYNDGDGNEDVLVCRTDPTVPSPSWSVGIKQGKGCTGLSCNELGMCRGVRARKKLLAPYLIKPRAGRSGPQGQTLKLRKLGDKLRIEAAGKTFDLAFDDYEVTEHSTLGDVWWRADGGAVAFALVSSGAFLFVRPLTGAAEPAAADSAQEVAKAANARGMHLYKARDWAGAAGEFRSAIAANAAWPTPRYNLACVLGRQRDVSGAVEQLSWLSKSSDPRPAAAWLKARLTRIWRWCATTPGFVRCLASTPLVTSGPVSRRRRQGRRLPARRAPAP